MDPPLTKEPLPTMESNSLSSTTTVVASPPPTDKQARPSLLSLPFEIQLKILKDCLVTSHFIVNLKDRIPSNHYLAAGEELGQDHISLNVLFTCRLYFEQGWKIFWLQNAFLFSSRAAYHLRIRRWPCGNPVLANLRRCTLRHAMLRDHAHVCDVVLLDLKAVQLMPCLEKLEVEMVLDGDLPRNRGPVGKLKSILGSRGIAERIFRAYRSGSPLKCLAAKADLESVSVSGMTVDEIGMLVVRMLSTLLRDGGSVGVSFPGKRYLQDGDTQQILHTRTGLEYEWIALGDVDDWIEQMRKVEGMTPFRFVHWDKFRMDYRGPVYPEVPQF